MRNLSFGVVSSPNFWDRWVPFWNPKAGRSSQFYSQPRFRTPVCHAKKARLGDPDLSPAAPLTLCVALGAGVTGWWWFTSLSLNFFIHKMRIITPVLRRSLWQVGRRKASLPIKHYAEGRCAYKHSLKDRLFSKSLKASVWFCPSLLTPFSKVFAKATAVPTGSRVCLWFLNDQLADHV